MLSIDYKVCRIYRSFTEIYKIIRLKDRLNSLNSYNCVFLYCTYFQTHPILSSLGGVYKFYSQHAGLCERPVPYSRIWTAIAGHGI